MATFTLTCIGDDRPGLVSELSEPINAHGASWARSQMARLGGKFAGILLLEVPDDRADALVADLAALKDGGLIRPGYCAELDELRDNPVEAASLWLQLELLGADRPGIVAEISTALAAHQVGIQELSTDVREAPMAGGHLFEARAVLEAPPSTSTDDLRSMLEAIADELMVEVRLSDAEEPASD